MDVEILVGNHHGVEIPIKNLGITNIAITNIYGW